MAPRSRRALLRTATAGLAAAAGCTGSGLPGPLGDGGLPEPFTRDAFTASYAPGATWTVEGHDAGRTSAVDARVPLDDVGAAWLRRPGEDPHGATAPVVGPERVHVAYAETPEGADASHAGLAGYAVPDGTPAYDVRLGPGRPAGVALAGDRVLVVRRTEDVAGAVLEGRSRVDGAADWSVSLADVTGPPAVRDGVVYLATRDGDDALLALDAADGTRRWHAPIDGPCYTAPCADAEGVYVGLADGRVAAVSAVDGSERWTAAVAAAAERPEEADGPAIQGMPTVADGRLYVPTIRETLVAVDAADGRVDWRATVVDDDYGNPVPSPAVTADTAYVNTHHGGLVALALGDGRVRWRADVPGSFLPPAVGRDGLVVPRGDAVVGYGADRRAAWTVDLPVPDAGMAAYLMEPRVALAHGLAVVALHDGRVYAIGQRA